MKLERIPSDLPWAKLEQEYTNARNFLLRLPNIDGSEMESIRNGERSIVIKICKMVSRLSAVSITGKVVVVLGPMHLLPYVYHSMNTNYTFKNLIAIRLSKPVMSRTFLPNEHFGAAVFTTSKNKSMNDVRKPYQHCKCCGNTVKDYGGKRHLMEMHGARITDVWTDITMNQNSAFPSAVVNRLFNMIRSDDSTFYAYNLSKAAAIRETGNLGSDNVNTIMPETNTAKQSKGTVCLDKIYNTDVFEGLQKIPDNVVDFALVDPPYNVSIKYGKLTDNLDDAVYLEWCKRWIDEVVRTLKNRGVLATVNIPRWALELFPYIHQKLSYVGWIVWDALSYPSSRVIPAHYPILCFSKGPLESVQLIKHQVPPKEYADILSAPNFGYCIRNSCIKKRTVKMLSDRRPLTDLWTDIHRIRHNSFRYSHPTLMPQKLARRLMLLCSEEKDTVLDCFNGVGTTTLVASSLNRRFLGIEKNATYFRTSMERHAILNAGRDPFARKAARSTSSAKGYRKRRTQSQIPKRELQMEVKRVARILGRCPSENELAKMGKYPLKIYFDNFEDWAEITVATRRTGIGKSVINIG